MSSEATEPITVFSDYVCPFCYLGRHSLRDYQQTRDTPLKIEWRPFDLRSQKRDEQGKLDPSADDGKDAEYYEQAKQNVRRLQEQYDVEMTVDLATDIDSLDAQIASYYVKNQHPYETWLDFDWAIFEALWVDGTDISDHTLLTSLAEDAGIDAEEIERALTDSALRTTVQNEFQAAQNMGVTGVPTFLYDEHAARGAVPPSQLERLVEGI